ncbi:MAG: hypothetical protein LBG59_06805 [Candidatus Peribacteria bacterium]|nr:hypothetical protein [Candidatus Peribacteria bacterium]
MRKCLALSIKTPILYVEYQVFIFFLIAMKTLHKTLLVLILLILIGLVGLIGMQN